MFVSRRIFPLGFGMLLFAFVGCDAQIQSFQANRLYGLVAAKREAFDAVPADELAEVDRVVEELFGTPNEPLVPESLAEWLPLEDLKRAAGPVYSDQADVHFGLFREHCANCHGVDGGGAGPAAALLNPYPRDFRAGVFKFKSTGRGDKPTFDDWVTLLQRGIPGTAMPSFATVRSEDLSALIRYSVYLSIRGETQRKLIDLVMSQDTTPQSLRELAKLVAAEIGAQWSNADEQVVKVPEVPVAQSAAVWWQEPAMIERGKELFHGPLANCASCHGPGGDGNATTLDFDDWTKEYTTKLGISPSDRAAVKEMRAAGALRPRQALPRKLQWGVYHGDDSDEALYRRLVTGIAGTPMPGLLVRPSGEEAAGASGVGVVPDDVWALVAYLRSLSEDSRLAKASTP